jgi:hypothetical protein
MSSIQKIALAIVGVGAITALVLPNRQSAAVIKAAGGAFSGALGTAITG